MASHLHPAATTPPPRRRRCLDLFRRSPASAPNTPETQAAPLPPPKPRTNLFRRSPSAAVLAPSQSAPRPPPSASAPASATPATTPYLACAEHRRSPSALSCRPPESPHSDIFVPDLPELASPALGMARHAPVPDFPNAAASVIHSVPLPSAVPPDAGAGRSFAAPRKQLGLHRSASEQCLPRSSTNDVPIARAAAPAPMDGWKGANQPISGCTTLIAQGERVMLSPVPTVQKLSPLDHTLYREPRQVELDAHPDPVTYTPSRSNSSEIGYPQSAPPSPLFQSDASVPLDQVSSQNMFSTVVSDLTSTRGSTDRGSVASSKTAMWVAKPPGPFSPGTMPTRENALPATAWTTIELALPKFRHATQLQEASGHTFDRAKLLRLVLQSFLRMEQERPLVRPGLPSAPSTPNRTMASLSEFSGSTPSSPAPSTPALSPPSLTSPLPPVSQSPPPLASAKQRAAEQAYQKYKDPRARSTLLLDWTVELMLSSKTAQSAGERMAMLESVNMLLEARNLSIDALLLPEVNQERERFDDTLFACLEYAIHELNRKGVYHNNLIFAGRLLSLALIRFPGVAHKLLGALAVSPAVLDRVSRAAKWDQVRPTGSAWEDYLACFPKTLQSICFDDARSYLSRVRATRRPQEPEEDAAEWQSRTGPTEYLVEHKGRTIAMEGNWLRRFQSDDSEVIYSFLRSFHRHLDRLVRTSLPPELQGLLFGAPGVAHITASIHQKSLSLVHRSLTSVTRMHSALTFNPGETANVLLGSTSGKPKQLEMATTRCVSAVVDAVTFGDQLSASELQSRLFLPTIQWHVALLVTRTSLYDVQGVFCLFDWLDSLMETLAKAHIPMSVVDVDFILLVLRRIFLETDHTVTLMRAIAFCYTNFALFMSTRMYRHGLADDTLLSQPIFTKLLLSWSPTIRAYFLHMLVFRFAHLPDFAPPSDDPHGQSTRHIVCLLHSRLDEVRAQYQRLCHEAGQASTSSSPTRSPLALDIARLEEQDQPVRPSLSAQENRLKVERLLGLSKPEESGAQAVHALGQVFGSAEPQGSDAAFDLHSGPAPPHLHTASRSFLARRTLLAGPAAELVFGLQGPPVGLYMDVECAFERAHLPYARMALWEYEQAVKDHDAYFATMPQDEHVADVPLLTVSWPAMWQGE